MGQDVSEYCCMIIKHVACHLQMLIIQLKPVPLVTYTIHGDEMLSRGSKIS